MNVYEATVPQLTKTLRNLDSWLAMGIAYADKRRFPVDRLLTARLAPDQYDLTHQVLSACDTAKFIPARLAGKDAPSHPDSETTMDQVRSRITTVVTYITAFTGDELAGAEDRKISLPWMDGKWMRGEEYVVQFALPNFYFHICTAYAILRHNGVELGKRDYLGSVPMRT